MLRYTTIIVVVILFLLLNVAPAPYSGGLVGPALADVEAAPGSLPREPGKPGWDETSINSAFTPGSRRGRNPVYAALGISRQALQDHSRQALQDDGGAGSANFQFAVPVLRLPGRGLDMALDLHYNSRLWQCTDEAKSGRCTGKMAFDMDGDWPAPGWSLGFGKLIGLYMLVDADGTRHQCKARETEGHRECYTPDGSYIDVWQSGNDTEARYPNGTVVRFGASSGYIASGPIVYPTQITDANGNYLSITYRNGHGPGLETITDTLGRVVRFYYDNANRLTAIEGPGLANSKRTLMRLHYRQWNLNYDFAKELLFLDCDNAGNKKTCLKPIITVSTVDAIYSPGTDTGYWFGDSDSFSPYGMLAKVSERRGMQFSAASLTDQGKVNNPGIMTRQQVYNYPRGPQPLLDVPTYTTMTESWEGMNQPAAVTQYLVKPDGSPRTYEVTYPDGSRSIQWSYNRPGKFNDGLNYETEVTDAKGNPVQSTLVTWELGDYDTPRIKRVEKRGGADFDNQVIEYSYGPEHNQVTEVRTYDYDGATLLRREQTEYVTDLAYRLQHIFNLPRVVQVFDGSMQTAASRVEYSYDGVPLADTPQVTSHLLLFDPLRAPTQQRCVHSEKECDPERKPPCVFVCVEKETVSLYQGTLRGLLTSITRYSDAPSRTGAITEKRRYDITGNLVAISGSCCEETTYTYTADTQYAYPTAVTRGAADPASTARVRTSTRYDFNTGLVMETTDAGGHTASYSYSAESLRLLGQNWATGRTTYIYGTTQMSVTARTFDQNDKPEAATTRYSNGLGLNYCVETWTDGDTWNVTETKYDNMGRVWKQSQPFRRANLPKDEQKYWSELTYDALGRVTRSRAADGSLTYWYYNETKRPDTASAALGQTVRAVDPWGREYWTRTNALGQLVEVVMPNPASDGSVLKPGSIATYYRYNGLGNLIEVQQQPEPQVRKFGYDSLGRLTHQYLPEKLSTLNDNGEYGEPDARWSDVFKYDEHDNVTSYTDARGVKTVYTYNNDPLDRLQSVSYDASGVKDASSPVLPAPAVHFTYTAGGDVTQLSRVSTDGLSTEEYLYDNEGRVSARTLTLSGRRLYPLRTDYRYDSLDRLIELISPVEYGIGCQRIVTRYSYHKDGLVNEVTIGGKLKSEAAYSPAGQLALMNLGSTAADLIKEVYDYDPVSQMLERQKITRGADVLLDLSYEYQLPLPKGPAKVPPEGRTGQVTRVVDHLNPAGSRSYAYDAWGRLTNAQFERSQPFSHDDWRQEYRYDVYGNRTGVKAFGSTPPVVCDKPFGCVPPSGPELSPSMRDGLDALTYDMKTNRITTAGYAYDAAGNQIRAMRADGSLQQYQYDAAGRLVKVLDNSGKLVETYTYSDTSRRRLSTHYGDQLVNPRYYLWDGNVVRAEYEDVRRKLHTPTWETASSADHCRVLDDADSLIERLFGNRLLWSKSYIYAGERLLATLTADTTGKGELVQFHHPDRLSTRLISNPANTEVVAQETLPFGTEMPGTAGAASNRKFTSYERSPFSKLDYAVNRFYDPQQGRFTQVDPLGMGASNAANPQSLNMYGYVKNDTVNYMDPIGLLWRLLYRGGGCVSLNDGPFTCTYFYDLVDIPDPLESRDLGDGLDVRGHRYTDDGSGGGGARSPSEERKIPPDMLVCKATVDWENLLLGRPLSPMPPGGYPLTHDEIGADRRTASEIKAARSRMQTYERLRQEFPGITPEGANIVQGLRDTTAWLRWVSSFGRSFAGFANNGSYFQSQYNQPVQTRPLEQSNQCTGGK